MKPILFAVFLSLPVALAASGPAAADSWKDESGHRWHERGHDDKSERKRGRHGHTYEWRDGNCKYEYKRTRHGYKEERSCRDRVRHAGGPPPWAPAHGYRRHHRGGHYDRTQTAYVPPFDLDLGSCNRALLGGVLGAAAGGLAGTQIGDGRGQLAATAAGTLLGFLVGGSIGRSMDELDRTCVGQALEHAGDGEEIVWDNPQTGAKYRVVPTRTVQYAEGRYCREYTATSVIAGRNQQTYGQACRQPDGSWQIVQ